MNMVNWIFNVIYKKAYSIKSFLISYYNSQSSFLLTIISHITIYFAMYLVQHWMIELLNYFAKIRILGMQRLQLWQYRLPIASPGQVCHIYPWFHLLNICLYILNWSRHLYWLVFIKLLVISVYQNKVRWCKYL